MIKHQAISAAQLLGCGGELAHNVLPAGLGVREGGVGQSNAIGAQGLSFWTLKTINVGLGHLLFTFPSKG